MTSTILNNELTHLISEAKRKSPDLRNAADKSLQELKGLSATSEQSLAADLSRRPTFIEPFLLACATRSARFATSGVNCLQRLIISKGLPKARLKESLEALNVCTSLGLDVQLKILQALPSLLQNYASDLKGELLSDALEICSSLQGAKAQTVSGVAAATLQQLVTSIFDKLAEEDRHGTNVPATDEIPANEGTIKVRPAAFDAYRVFRDLALAAEHAKTEFVQFASLSQEAVLELIWTCLNARPQLFASHQELNHIVRTDLLPLVTHAISEKLSFGVTVRLFRILDLVLARCISDSPKDCELILGLLTHTLEPDAAPIWKRALAMEILRSFFSDGTSVIHAYAAYDMGDGGKAIVQDLMSAFVRLSAEKPAVIGLGQQSTVPAGPAGSREQNGDHTISDSNSGMSGLISSALGVVEANVPGISSRWSIPRSPCLEQLDKSEPPSIPETYVYTLVLDCLSSLSDCLAKIILPLTVASEKSKLKSRDGQHSADGQPPEVNQRSSRHRSQSYLERSVPLNPLEQQESDVPARVRTVKALVENCWPAILATSSTFFNAALDDQYYRSLIKAYQRFAQVAGLLRLSTARDALMTTLGKAAIPSHVVNSAIAEPPRTPTAESPRVFSNPKSLLSVDSLVNQASTIAGDRERHKSMEPSSPMLTTRNLLCLRALLNLAIALGPTLNTAFAVVVETLRQADLVLGATTPQQMIRQGLSASQKASDQQDVVQAFSNEVTAVEAAASRLLESTADYPDASFLHVLNSFCRLLEDPGRGTSPSLHSSDHVSPPPTPNSITRTFSGFTGFNGILERRMRNLKFVIPRLGNLAKLNVSRFASGNPNETGWNTLVDQLLAIASDDSNQTEARRAATDVLCKTAAEILAEVMEEDEETRASIQRRTLAVLLRIVDGIYEEDGEITSGDVDVQGYVLDAMQAILERCGESLVAGWNRTLAILSSVFEQSGNQSRHQEDEGLQIDWEQISDELVSGQLGKTGFAATQLICSDFLSALPIGVMPSLIELLRRFATQGDDLNIALSTVTMAWNVSDFLLSKIVEDDLDQLARNIFDADSFEDGIQRELSISPSSQWLLLLLRLRDIVGIIQREVRQAAFQTICSILKENGTKMSPLTWSLILRNIVFKLAFQDVSLYFDDTRNEETVHKHQNGSDEAISTVIIGGSSEIVAQHMNLLEQVKQLPSLWEAYLGRLEAYVDVGLQSINSAVYRALGEVLSHISVDAKIWTGPMYRTLALWLKRNPALLGSDEKNSNQETLIAYVEAGSELYRLTQQSMSISQTRTLVENLYMSIQHADGPGYGADTNSLSSLQAKAFELLRSVHTDSPSTLVVVASKLTTLAHDAKAESSQRNGPTFVAAAGDAIDWTQSLVLSHIANGDLFDTGVVVGVLENLRYLIEQKYAVNLESKGSPLWRQATKALLALAGPIVQQSEQQRLDSDTQASLWLELVKAANAVVHANGLDLLTDVTRIESDQSDDVESFKSLQTILVPQLGSDLVPESTRTIYCRALFEASIIHPTEVGEVPESGISPLHNIRQIRHGRVKRVPYSQRETMCYECFSHLIDLSGSPDDSVESKKLARVAAPFAILRLAIPIRAYIADQPLRGRRPQPLSQLEELLFCFEVIKNFKCGSDALLVDSSAKANRNAHLHYLYQLLVKAVGTAGDRWSGADEVLQPLQSLLETIQPILG